MKTKLAIPFLLSLCACGSDFEPPSRIGKLRLLAVRAEPAWAAPGETVELEALALDPEARTISWGFAACVDPPGSGVTDCIDALPRPVTLTPGGPAFSLRVPDDTIARLLPQGRAGAMVGVVVVACPGTIVAGDTQGVPIACVSRGRQLRLDEFEIGMKRVFVRNRDRNANPTLTTVTWDGAPWPEGEVKEVDACDTDGDRFDACDGAQAHTLAAPVAQGESGVDELGVPFSEQGVVEYYATEGIFEHDVRIADAPETRWAARNASRGKTVTLFAIARDSRGGVGWTTRTVRVR